MAGDHPLAAVLWCPDFDGVPVRPLPTFGTVTAYPAVDPDGFPRNDLAEVAWDDDASGTEILPVGELQDRAVAAHHPEVEVQLSGEDGNAFSILGRVCLALQRVGIPQAEIDAYVADASSGDYNHLLAVTMANVSVL